MPAPGLQPLDEQVLQRLDPAHRELVVLLRKLYDAQIKLLSGKPRTLAALARATAMSRSRVSEIMSGKECPVYAHQVSKLAEILGGSEQDLSRAAKLFKRIDRSTGRRWWMAGTDARSHFDGRASGRRPSDGRGSDLFTGRVCALKAPA